MKFLWLGLGLLLNFSVQAQALEEIVLATHQDPQVISSLLERVRGYFIAQKKIDPYKHTWPGERELKVKIGDLDQESFWDDLQEILRLNFIQTQIRFITHDLAYEVGKFSTEIENDTKSEGSILYRSKNFVEKFEIKAKLFEINFVIPRKNEQRAVSFSIKLKNPKFRLKEPALAEIFVDWETTLRDGKFQISVDKVDVLSLVHKWQRHPELVDISLDDIEVPELKIQIGNKPIIIYPEKVKAYILKDISKLKVSLLNLVVKNAGVHLKNLVEGNPQTIEFPDFQNFRAETFQGNFVFKSQEWLTGGVLINEVKGDFCARNLAKQGCEKPYKLKPFEAMTAEREKKSLEAITSILAEGKTETILSVHEHYFNRLFLALKKGKALDRFIGEDFQLGSRGIFTAGNQVGHNFILYVDVIYPLNRFNRILLRKTHLQFPVKFLVGLKVDLVDKVPHLRIDLKENLTDDEILLNGIKEYGLESSVGDRRLFRGKVMSKIYETLGAFIGSRILDLPLPELKGTYLDQTTFFSDGQGRALGILKQL